MPYYSAEAITAREESKAPASKPATSAKPAARKPVAKRTAPRKPAAKPATKAPASKPATERKSRAGAARYAPRGPKGETKQSLTAQIFVYLGNSIRAGNLKPASVYLVKHGDRGLNPAKVLAKFAADHKAGRTYLVDVKPVSAYVISESGKPVNGTQRVMLDRLFTKYAK